METRSDWKLYMDYLYIAAGTLLCAIAVTSVFDAQGMVIGGLSGLSIIIKQLTGNMFRGMPEGIPLWFTNVIVNIPLFIFGGRYRGKQFLIRTTVATLLFIIFLGVLPPFSFFPRDPFFGAVAGGAMMGFGMGLIFVAGAASGGSDLLASILQKKLRQVSIPVIMAVIDGVIVLAGSFVFGMTNAVYAVVAIYIESRLADNMLTGISNSKMVYIISDNSGEISKIIMQELERGVTGLRIRGMYTGKERDMLLCVVADKELIKLKDIVASCDTDAFVIVMNAAEALGEGSISHLAEIKKNYGNITR